MRISNVEITNAGQAYRIGRHPLTFTANGNMMGSYFKHSVIHRSFNRAVNIHLTDTLLFEANVLHDIKGGGFVLQDGRETGNEFRYNLAVFVRSSSSSYNQDLTPAAFMLANPANTLLHNSAVGCSHYGFWYRTLDAPEDPAAAGKVRPNLTPLGKFFNNSAHSVGRIGLWIFPGYTPTQQTNAYYAYSVNSYNLPRPAVFDYFTSYSCDKAAEFVNSNSIQFRHFIAWDHFSTAIGTQSFSSQVDELNSIYNAFNYNETTGSVLLDSVIVGCSSDECLLRASAKVRGVTIAAQRGQLIKNVSFINYPNSSAFIWSVAI